MSVAQNLKLAVTFEAAFNARDWDRLGGTLADSVVVHDPVTPEPINGRDAVLAMFRANVEYFPTARIEGVRRFGQEDWVCVQNVETGAQKDTAKRYRIDTCYTLKIANDRLSEVRFYYDALGMMTQLGMSP